MSRRPDVRRVDAATAVGAVSRALVAAGSNCEKARQQAEHLVEAELRGHPSHGIRRLAVLVGRIRAGVLDPNSAPSLVWGARSALTVDGNLGFGPVVAYAAIDAITERVAETGVAVAAMSRTQHLGMLAPYVERMAERGCIGIVLSSTEGLVHPWGGGGALLGTNPVSASVPSADSSLVLDMSTGAVSAGKILHYAERGRPLPDGWAVDAAGKPTSDAAAAVNGAISPFGGAKGYALGLTLGAVVGALTGTAFGADVTGTLDTSSNVTKGDVIMAIRLGAFGQPARSSPLAEYLGVVRASGVDGARVSVPGDRAQKARRRALAKGFDVTQDVWNEVEALAAGADANSEEARQEA